MHMLPWYNYNNPCPYSMCETLPFLTVKRFMHGLYVYVSSSAQSFPQNKSWPCSNGACVWQNSHQSSRNNSSTYRGSIVFLDPAGSQTLTLQTMVSDTFHFLLGIFFETLLRGTPIQMKKITSSVGLLHEDRNQSSPQITTK